MNLREVRKLAEKHCASIKELAMENRSTIYKRELEQEINQFRASVLYVHKAFKKKSVQDNLRVLFKYDKKGYTDIDVIFKFTEEEKQAIIEDKMRALKEHGSYASSIWRKEEALYKVSWDRLKKIAGPMLGGDKKSPLENFGMYNWSDRLGWFPLATDQCERAIR